MKNFNLNNLPAANIIAKLDYEQLLNDYKNDLLNLLPSNMRQQLQERLEFESEPLLKLLQAAAYRELLLRAQINQAAKACMIAYASGSDLDNLVANFAVKRQLISPANNEVSPPVPAIFEDDNSLRTRAAQAFHGLSVAGSAKSYEFFARSAHGGVLDVKAISPAPAVVDVIVLAKNNEGTPSANMLAIIAAVLNGEDVRPIGDLVNVIPCEVMHYQIKAKIYATKNKDVIIQKGRENLQKLASHCFKIGVNIPLSAIYAAMHINNVDKVELLQPLTDLNVNKRQALYCDAIDLILV